MQADTYVTLVDGTRKQISVLRNQIEVCRSAIQDNTLTETAKTSMYSIINESIAELEKHQEQLERLKDAVIMFPSEGNLVETEAVCPKCDEDIILALPRLLQGTVSQDSQTETDQSD